MSRLAAFDLEIAKVLPTGETDWHAHRPLGISCAAIQLSDWDPRGHLLIHYTENPALSHDECQVLVAELQSLANGGYTLVGWNSASFDWAILAEESGLHQECAQLALGHVDLMFIVVTLRGHMLGLEKACQGAGVKGKLKDVTLKDGSVLSGMDGARAPELWQAGEYDAVLAYLADDVRCTLELAQAVEEQQHISWLSAKGYPQTVHIPQLYTVAECLRIKREIPHWVTSPVSRRSFVEWMGDAS